MSEAPVEKRGNSVGKFVGEIILIAVGVFLGLAADQWRDNVKHRQAAHESLERFRAEVVTNRKAVSDALPYHIQKFNAFRSYLDQPRKGRDSNKVDMHGLRPVPFEHTAWDLALATQSLGDIPPSVAFELSRVYNEQQRVTAIGDGAIRSLYALPIQENFDGFAWAVTLFFSDVTEMEPEMIKMYDALLPLIDKALAQK